MTNKEVGSQPEIVESWAERIYILPKAGRDKSDGLGIFILADGNNRSKTVNGTDYDDGGKNVIRIAETLAERGDVSIMVGSILSPDNIAKRSDRFFYEMYIAFIGLGMRIESEKTLIKSNIRLEVHGDLAALRSKGGYAVKLADMMKAVCAKTAHLVNPRLRLILGVNYDEDSALDLGCNMIFRSGMDNPQMLRLSGTRSHECIYAYGSTKLWPEVTPQEINGVVDDVKKRTTDVFQLGYSIDFMINFLRAQNIAPIDEPFHATLAVCSSEHEIRSALVDYFNRYPDSANILRVTVESKNNGELIEFGNAHSNKVINIILGSRAHMQSERPSSYSSILAPGQSEGPFKLPTFPDVGYANIQRCDATPEGVIEGIRRAIAFNRSHVSLKGAERKIEPAPAEPALMLATEIPEYSHFELLKEKIADMIDLPSEQIAQILSAEFPHNLADKYDLTADVFTAKMMRWAERIGMPLLYAPQYRALINYFLTSYFLVYFPDHPEWHKYSSTWEKDAGWLAKYMGIVYLTDENIFDIKFEDENLEEKNERLRLSSRYIQHKLMYGPKAVQKLPKVRQADVLHLIAEAWDEFLIFFSGGKNTGIFINWKKALSNLYQSHLNEWESRAIRNPLVTDLSSAALRKYLPMLPTELQQDFEQSYAKATSLDPEILIEGRYTLYLLTYLADINDSIGAGIAYRTVALTLEEDFDEDTRILFDDICTLSNFAFRIANDMADFISRDPNDSDNKFDSVHITLERFSQSHSCSEAIIQTLSFLKQKRSEMEKQVVEKVNVLSGKFPKVAIAIKRASIARDIYQEGHYRTITRGKMTNLFSKHRMTGIL